MPSKVRVGGHVGLGVGEATHDLQPIANLAWHWPANRNLLGVTPRRDLMRDSLLALCAAKFTPVTLVSEITCVSRSHPHHLYIYSLLIVLIEQSKVENDFE